MTEEHRAVSCLTGHDRHIHRVTFPGLDWAGCGYGRAACGVDAIIEHYYPVESFAFLPTDGECPACFPATDPAP